MFRFGRLPTSGFAAAAVAAVPAAAWGLSTPPPAQTRGFSFLRAARLGTTNSALKLADQKAVFGTQRSLPRLLRNNNNNNNNNNFTSSVNPSSSVTSFFGGGNKGGGDNSVQDALSGPVRDHLIKVYNLLAGAVGLAAVGSALMIATPLGKMVPFWLPMVGGFVPLLWLIFRPPANPNARLALYFSFALIEGMALAPIVKMSAAAGVLGTALILTGAVFCGFSAAAFLAPRASLLAFQGPLYGLLIGMVAVSVLSMFWPTAFAHSLILYGGLALFSALVAVDTQAMIERARCGVSDPTQDALQMFLSVINIFVRIAAILRSMSE